MGNANDPRQPLADARTLYGKFPKRCGHYGFDSLINPTRRWTLHAFVRPYLKIIIKYVFSAFKLMFQEYSAITNETRKNFNMSRGKIRSWLPPLLFWSSIYSKIGGKATTKIDYWLWGVGHRSRQSATEEKRGKMKALAEDAPRFEACLMIPKTKETNWQIHNTEVRGYSDSS